MKPNSREESDARATLAGHAPVTQSEGPVGSRFVITTPARTLPESARRIPYLHFWGWVVKTRPTRGLRTADDNDDFVPDKRCQATAGDLGRLTATRISSTGTFPSHTALGNDARRRQSVCPSSGLKPVRRVGAGQSRVLGAASRWRLQAVVRHCLGPASRAAKRRAPPWGLRCPCFALPSQGLAVSGVRQGFGAFACRTRCRATQPGRSLRDSPSRPPSA